MMSDLVVAPEERSASKATPHNALSQIVGEYLANFLSSHTRAAYENDFRDFGAFLVGQGFMAQHPRDIKKAHVIAYRDSLRERYSPTSINRKLSALSSLFSELQNAQVIDVNPTKGVKRPQSTSKRPRLGFTDKEVNQILSAHPTETLQGLNNHSVLAFLLFTGCRISEALDVRVRDIESRGHLQVVHIRGKGEKIRRLPMHPKLAKVITELITRREKKWDDFLFTRVKGAPGKGNEEEPLRRQSVGELLKLTLKRLGLDTNRSLHSSRRTVISNLLENGSRIESVAELAGHANINTTQKYNVRKEALEDNPLLTLRYQDG
jgi:site-specific recombinase XerD